MLTVNYETAKGAGLTKYFETVEGVAEELARLRRRRQPAHASDGASVIGVVWRAPDGWQWFLDMGEVEGDMT